jgi:hypothetical protein
MVQKRRLGQSQQWKKMRRRFSSGLQLLDRCGDRARRAKAVHGRFASS